MAGKPTAAGVALEVAARPTATATIQMATPPNRHVVMVALAAVAEAMVTMGMTSAVVASDRSGLPESRLLGIVPEAANNQLH